MQIGNWIIQRYLQIQKKKQDRKLNEIRAGLRRVQSASPQLSAMVRPELERVRQLSRQLRKVRSREDLKRWRSLYEMCQPAFEATLNVAPARKTTGKRRKKGRGKPT
jgi:hypothetical protein